MDPASLLGIAMTLIEEGPAAISFVTSTYKLFAGGTLTADQLQALWVTAATSVQTAKAKWDASRPVS